MATNLDSSCQRRLWEATGIVQVIGFLPPPGTWSELPVPGLALPNLGCYWYLGSGPIDGSFFSFSKTSFTILMFFWFVFVFERANELLYLLFS